MSEIVDHIIVDLQHVASNLDLYEKPNDSRVVYDILNRLKELDKYIDKLQESKNENIKLGGNGYSVMAYVWKFLYKYVDRINFDKAIMEWLEHCRKSRVMLSSSYREAFDCRSYRTIVLMDRGALPLIKKFYKKKKKDIEYDIVKQCLVSVIIDIVGKVRFSIPDSLTGNIKGIEEYTMKWLNENVK